MKEIERHVQLEKIKISFVVKEIFKEPIPYKDNVKRFTRTNSGNYEKLLKLIDLNLNPQVLELGEMLSKSKSVIIKCNKCGIIHEEVIKKVIRNNNTKCSLCRMSKGERKIYKLLDELNIKFKKEYLFDDLISENNVPFRFDFAIFNNDGELKLIIEYDGRQPEFHEPTIKNNKIKNTYCIKNKIKLLRISYKNFSKCELIVMKELYKLMEWK